MESLSNVINEKIDLRLSEENDDSFLILDVEDVRMKYRKWMEKMSRVVPFYAVKCNDDVTVLKTLVNMGTDFDCASKEELEQMLELGVKPEKIIYAQIKQFQPNAENSIICLEVKFGLIQSLKHLNS